MEKQVKKCQTFLPMYITHSWPLGSCKLLFFSPLKRHLLKKRNLLIFFDTFTLAEQHWPIKNWGRGIESSKRGFIFWPKFYFFNYIQLCTLFWLFADFVKRGKNNFFLGKFASFNINDYGFRIIRNINDQYSHFSSKDTFLSLSENIGSYYKTLLLMIHNVLFFTVLIT